MASPNTITAVAIVHLLHLVAPIALPNAITKAAIVDSFHSVTLHGGT